MALFLGWGESNSGGPQSSEKVIRSGMGSPSEVSVSVCGGGNPVWLKGGSSECAERAKGRSVVSGCVWGRGYSEVLCVKWVGGT